MKKTLINLGKVFFILAVALLLIRKSSYPWIIKRSSDVLFLLSFLSCFWCLVTSSDYVRKLKELRNVVKGFVLLIGGLIFASVFAYFADGVLLRADGLLFLGRFLEIGMILFLIWFLQGEDSNFYKKVAIAQLSTVLYIPVIFFNRSDPSVIMSRFQLFENWPSNVSYYLIVSLSLVIVFLLFSPKKSFLVYFILGVGLFGIMLWTQSRAGLLGFLSGMLVIVLIFSLRARDKKLRRFVMSGFLILVLIVGGFFVLPSKIQNLVVIRFFPQMKSDQNIYSDSHEFTQRMLQDVSQKKLSPRLNDPSRLYLWKTYGSRVLSRPMGLGLNYQPEYYSGSFRGPHNTFLEALTMGGILTLIGFVYLIFLAFKNLKVFFRSSLDFTWPTYVLASLVGLLVASFFDNMVVFRLMWVMIGLGMFVFTYEYKRFYI